MIHTTTPITNIIITKTPTPPVAISVQCTQIGCIIQEQELQQRVVVINNNRQTTIPVGTTMTQLQPIAQGSNCNSNSNSLMRWIMDHRQLVIDIMSFRSLLSTLQHQGRCNSHPKWCKVPSIMERLTIIITMQIVASKDHRKCSRES